MAFWDSLVAQGRQIWGGLTKAQRAVLVGVSVGLALGLGALALWTGTPEYAVLFARLTQADAAAVVERLQDQGVAYRLADGGSTVEVPADRVYDLRLALAGEGIPAGGVVGFEIFDRSGFGMTDFAQKVNYARALEGELTRTILRLDGVEGARVHLVLPERRLFEEEEEPASASVVLQLAPGRRPQAKQIQGIVYLVASSVEGLDPERVAVVDTRGNVLYRAAPEGAEMLATNQLEFKRAYERDVEGRVRDMLERMLGPGAAVVQVAAEFDFDRVEETSETFDPEAVAVRSEERVTEAASGLPSPAGVPGVASNVGEGAGAAAGGGGSSNRETETVNYEVSKRITRVQRTPGVLRRLTVAVAVDGTYREGAEGQGKEFVPRSPEEIARIRALVEKAVGADGARGDAVEVTSIPFRPAEGVVAAEAGPDVVAYLPLIKYGLGAVLALSLLLFVARPLVKWLTRPPPAAEVTEPLTVEEMEKRLEEAGPEVQLEEEMPPETARREALKGRILQTIRGEPEVAAQLIRGWMSEE